MAGRVWRFDVHPLRPGDLTVVQARFRARCSGPSYMCLERVLTRYTASKSQFVERQPIWPSEAPCARTRKTRLFESISNPALESLTLPGIAKNWRNDVGAMVMVDNVFATPVYSRALELGADAVIYSANQADRMAKAVMAVVILQQRVHDRARVDTLI